MLLKWEREAEARGVSPPGVQGEGGAEPQFKMGGEPSDGKVVLRMRGKLMGQQSCSSNKVTDPSLNCRVSAISQMKKQVPSHLLLNR